MATGTEAVERIAEVTGLALVTVDRAARFLKQHTPEPLWSRSLQGGGKGASHVELRHLVNLTLALVVADPITSAPKAVAEWRALPPRRSTGWAMHYHSKGLYEADEYAAQQGTSYGQLRGCCFGPASIALDEYRDSIYPDLPRVMDNGRWSGQGDPRCYQVLPGDSLGQALELFIDYLASPESNHTRSLIKRVTWKIDFWSTKSCGITLHENQTTLHSRFELPSSDLNTPGLIRSALLSFEVFEVLADLWADTQRHHAAAACPLPATAGGGRPSRKAKPQVSGMVSTGSYGDAKMQPEASPSTKVGSPNGRESQQTHEPVS